MNESHFEHVNIRTSLKSFITDVNVTVGNCIEDESLCTTEIKIQINLFFFLKVEIKFHCEVVHVDVHEWDCGNLLYMNMIYIIQFVFDAALVHISVKLSSSRRQRRT